MRYIPQNNMFGIIESLSQIIERGEPLSSQEIDYLIRCEEMLGIAFNQIEYIRTRIQSQEINR